MEDREEQLSKILQDCEPEFIPEQYVYAIVLTYNDGRERIVTPEDFDDIIETIINEDLHEALGIAKAQTLIDIPLVKKDVKEATDLLLKKIPWPSTK